MSVFSPRFKSIATMAGWDEETLLLASLVVEDTPDRNLKNKKGCNLQSKSPSCSSSGNPRRWKRRGRVGSISMQVLNLDDDDDGGGGECVKKDKEKGKNDLSKKVEEKTTKEKEEEKSDKCSSSSTLACMDKLREELSCAICLDICYEPSTTPCGHSFCKNCLKSAADKCGKRCPKCRQLISNGRSCTINTVLWNTIQLLFPQEIETRKAALSSSRTTNRSSDYLKNSPETMISSSSNQGNSNSSSSSTSTALMTRRLRVSRRSTDANLRTGSGSTRGVPNQDEDAALALRLQREEFMEIYRGSSLARDNLRAMARRAMNLARNRG